METPSPDLYSDTYNDIYFCEEDGLAEGFHVFLNGNGLPERFAGEKNFVIAETGFGTGLNFLASWLAFDEIAKPGQHLTYISFEKFPLSVAQIEAALARWKEQLGGRLEKMLSLYPIRAGGWHPIRIAPHITLLLIFDDVNRALPELNAQVDAWFLDGFAPAKNPEMWSETVFTAMARNSHSKTTVASFTAAGLVKRGLRDQGFYIAKRRGYGRKRDMIFGHFEGQRQKHDALDVRSIAVIGGGLAGTSVASRLKQEGFSVDLYEANEIASGASGNARGLFNPRFTSARNAVSEFYASAYALALRRFTDFEDIDFKKCGSVHLLTDAEKEKRLKGALENWNWHEDHMRLIDADEASSIAGIELPLGALYLSDAGFVNPQKLCQEFSDGINVINQSVDRLDFQQYDVIIVASGQGAISFAETSSLPLSTVRGQIVYASSTPQTEKIKANICYGGYCSPAYQGFHTIGSTFQPWLTDKEMKAEDNDAIISNLESHVPSLSDEMKAMDARAALRVASKDRFPVIGQIPASGRLYISAAHGSHGLISAILGAEIIAAHIMGRVQPVPNSVLAALSPMRFAEREAKKAS